MRFAVLLSAVAAMRLSAVAGVGGPSAVSVTPSRPTAHRCVSLPPRSLVVIVLRGRKRSRCEIRTMGLGIALRGGGATCGASRGIGAAGIGALDIGALGMGASSIAPPGMSSMGTAPPGTSSMGIAPPGMSSMGMSSMGIAPPGTSSMAIASPSPASGPPSIGCQVVPSSSETSQPWEVSRR